MDWDYFFQHIFGGLATIITGLVAWIIYVRSRRDRKVESALIILNEITSAEKEIDQIRKSGIIVNYTSILPSSHWDDFQHLFVKDFRPDEISRISDFYKSCSLAEESLDQIRSYLPFAMDEKSRSIQKELIALADKQPDKGLYTKEKERILETFHKEDYWFLPKAPQDDLIKYLKGIEKLLPTTTGERLRSICGLK